MERTEKIDALVEFFDENHIKMIDTTCIGSVIVDEEQTLHKEDDNLEYNELLDKGLTDDDIESLKKFLEKMIIFQESHLRILNMILTDCMIQIYGKVKWKRMKIWRRYNESKSV